MTHKVIITDGCGSGCGTELLATELKPQEIVAIDFMPEDPGKEIKTMKIRPILRGIMIATALILTPIMLINGCAATEPAEPTLGGEEAGAIQGTVTGVDGKPVAGMRVSIVSGTTGFPEILALTDERGRYTIGSVPAGRFEVAVHDVEGKEVASGSVIVRGGETAILDFSVPATATGKEMPPAKTIAEDWSADGILGNREYFTDMVAADGNYELRMRTDEQYLYIGIKARTSGWVAVGFEPSSKMKDADIILGFVQDGKTTISDQFSTSKYGVHIPDTKLGGSDDILEFGGKEEGDFTTIEFKRALNTGDQYDKVLTHGVINIIWSYGSTDEITTKHVTRGTGKITF